MILKKYYIIPIIGLNRKGISKRDLPVKFWEVPKETRGQY
jgi:hypothetical protein